MRWRIAYNLSQTEMDSAPATYILMAHLRQSIHITTSKQPYWQLTSDYYLYIGSAIGSGDLQARIGGQLQSMNKMRWHIDYLLAHTAVAAVWNVDGPRQ